MSASMNGHAILNHAGPTASSSADPYPAQSGPAFHAGQQEASGSLKRKLSDGLEDENNGEDVKPAAAVKEGKGGASEFVKKLYRMLEDANFAEIVSWGSAGDSFVVKDMNSFTRSILPLHFKHSNFASFVRQLNKYDFHKVKNSDEAGSPYGEHTWEFRHPSFRADMKESLEQIKRKAPAPRKSTPTPAALRKSSNLAGTGPGSSSKDSPPMHPSDMNSIQSQLEQLHRGQHGMSQHMLNLSQDYQAVIGELMSFQRNMVAQDQLMQNLIQYLVNLEADQKAAANPTQASSPFVPSSQAQKLISSYTEVSRAAYDQMTDLSRRASLSNGALPPIPLPPPGFGHLDFRGGRMSGDMGRREGSASGSIKGESSPGESSFRGGSSSSYDPRDTGYRPPLQSGMQQQQPHPGHTRGTSIHQHPSPQHHQQQAHHQQQQQQQQQQHHQQQQAHHQQQQQQQAQQAHAQAQQQQHQQQQQQAAQAQAQQQQQQQQQQHQAQQQSQLPQLHIQHPNAPPLPASEAENTNRRPTYVPGWAVPPRVLLVEDDAVCRKLSSKFLQVFGCEIDVAVDGVSAVNKMNKEKYDLVLMDIVMPNLDGVSATSLIRQFDPMTPIISMTSNSGPNEIMTYFSHGMNDILPKPFTKEGLLGMLEKHLIHLKVMQQMAEIPRALGFTDNQIQDALAVSAVSEDGNVINPFSAMGISDGDYVEMLRGIATEREGKTGLVVEDGDEREGKRARFAVN